MDMQLSAVYIFNQKGCFNPMGSGQNSGCNVDNPSHSKPILSPIPREAEGGSVSSSGVHLVSQNPSSL